MSSLKWKAKIWDLIWDLSPEDLGFEEKMGFGIEIWLNDLNLLTKWFEIWQWDLIWDLPITDNSQQTDTFSVLSYVIKFWTWLLSAILLGGKMLLASATVSVSVLRKFHVICLFTLWDFIYWKKLVGHYETDFSKIRDNAVTKFLTLENVQPQEIQWNDCCLWLRCAIICHSQVLGSLVLLRQKKPWTWALAGTSVWNCLQLKMLDCEIIKSVCSW